MTLHDAALQFSKCVLDDFNKSLQSATKEEIEQADGRRGPNPISQKGSCLYAAYGSNGQLLYVGETGESLKDRFINHGSGSHKEKHGYWYKNMATVKYKKLRPSDGKYDDKYDERYRKLLERALILAGAPKHNDQSKHNDQRGN